mgnify:CR=1 FL=1
MSKDIIVKKSNEIFQRYEKKYILTKVQHEQFLERVKDYIEMDQFGESTICNLYYDTPSYELIRSSIEKPVYKEKLRLRSYGIPRKEDETFVEIKKKYDGIVYKRRIELPFEESTKYLDHGISPSKVNQIKKEIDYFVSYYEPVKKMYIAYDRTAMIGKYDDSIRVTFDRNIRYRMNDLDLGKGDYGTLVLSPETVLMEIKVAGAYPLWMVSILSELQLYPTSFSKYGSCYQRELVKQKDEYELEKTKEQQEVVICLPA